MPDLEIELNPIDFITIGTVGPKGRREFNLQAGKDQQLVTVSLEKQQARQLAEAINELLRDLKQQSEGEGESDAGVEEIVINLRDWNMELREPIEVQFRVARMGLGYDDTRELIILVAQELINPDEFEDPDLVHPSIVRLWGTREQYKALSEHTISVVDQGRPDPRQNGHVIYYWT